MRQIVSRVEDSVSVIAQVSGCAHAVEEESEINLRGTRIITVTARIKTNVRCASTVKLRKERAKPVRVLVINSNRFFYGHLLNSLKRKDRSHHTERPLRNC